MLNFLKKKKPSKPGTSAETFKKYMDGEIKAILDDVERKMEEDRHRETFERIAEKLRKQKEGE